MMLVLPETAPAVLLDAAPACEQLLRRLLASLTDIEADKTFDADLVLVQEAFDTPSTSSEREIGERAQALSAVLARCVQEVRRRGLLLEDHVVSLVRQAEAAIGATFPELHAALRRRAVIAEALLDLLGT
ncbi:hypothetical protein [Streptomyces sp. NPDC054975]